MEPQVQIRKLNQNKNTPGHQSLLFYSSSLVRSSMSGWHRLEQDLLTLYERPVDLGMEYRDGRVYLADVDKEFSLPDSPP